MSDGEVEEERGKGGDVTEQVGRSHIKKHLEFPLRALDFSCAQQRAIEKKCNQNATSSK